MASISLTDPVAGTTVTAGLHAGNNAALRTAVNGGLDNTNLAASPAIGWGKLALNRGTTFPGSPADGEQYVYVADATNGTQWTFKYNTGSASAFKWEYVGGSVAYAAVETSQTTASAALTDLATVGPSFTVPRAGDYLFRYNVDVGNSGAGNSDVVALMKNGVEADRMTQQIVGGGGQAAVMREILLTGLAGSDAFKLQYLTTAGTATFQRRRLTVVPVRVS